MTTVALAAQSRTETGKGVARSLRRQALIPAVFYGPEVDPIPLILQSKDLEKLITTGAGENILIDLNIEDGKSTQSHRAMIKEIQVDPVKQNILHVDLYAISMVAVSSSIDWIRAASSYIPHGIWQCVCPCKGNRRMFPTTAQTISSIFLILFIIDPPFWKV